MSLPKLRHPALRWTVLACLLLAACLALAACGGGVDEAGPYHCPMHPTVVQDDPGDCPICGMRLVPIEEEQEDHAGHDHARGQEPESWHCPMHPTVVEDTPGDCPICGMRLVPVEEGPAPPGPSAPAAQWHCPMHPTVVQDEPGDCPICGMDLVEIDEPARGPGAAAAQDEVPGYAAVRIPGARRQLIGVRTTPVQRRSLAKTIRTVATVETDETRVHHIHSKVNGWVEKLGVSYTGQPVRRGQALFDLYSPDLVATQEEYLLALRSLDELGSSPVSGVAESARRLVDSTERRLRLWDVPRSEIQKLRESRAVRRTLTFYAPVSGFVTEKWVESGMYVDPGKMLFTIADLSRVWVMADIYEYELSLVEEGQQAALSVSAYPGQVFHGQVDYVYPTVDPSTRTATVRFSYPNEELRLKPGMYATVVLQVDLGVHPAVPEAAVLDTGKREIVFVDRGDGWFEPRQIETGARAEGWREVLRGLHPGESVVTNGNFMIDSESRLRASIQEQTSRKTTGSAEAEPTPGHRH